MAAAILSRRLDSAQGGFSRPYSSPSYPYGVGKVFEM
jgi:hypothetical protein